MGALKTAVGMFRLHGLAGHPGYLWTFSKFHRDQPFFNYKILLENARKKNKLGFQFTWKCQ